MQYNFSIKQFGFSPVYEFGTKDSRNEDIAIIKKHAKFELTYPKETDELDILHHIRIITLFSTFLIKSPIEYDVAKIGLNHEYLTIRKKNKK